LPENDFFNNHIHVAIRDKNGHKIATYWVAMCVALHAFAMQWEDHNRSDDGMIGMKL